MEQRAAVRPEFRRRDGRKRAFGPKPQAGGGNGGKLKRHLPENDAGDDVARCRHNRGRVGDSRRLAGSLRSGRGIG